MWDNTLTAISSKLFFFSCTSAALTCTKTYSFILMYILKAFTVGFVHISFAGFIIVLNLFAFVDFNYNKFILKIFFLHFSSTYMHQTLQFYSHLYSEGFYCGVCSYFIRWFYYCTLSICVYRFQLLYSILGVGTIPL